MKIQDISPKRLTGIPFKDGQKGKISTWSYEDIGDLYNIRQVFHHKTLMGQFEETPEFGWVFEPISVGLGSKSDQEGMNAILGGEWVYYRSGGDPRYVAYDGVTVVRDSLIDY